jgi:hypothetical protein
MAALYSLIQAMHATFRHYKHLGKAGSSAHVDGVIQVVRRVQIDELRKAVDSLKQSWSELYSGNEGERHRADP